MTAIEWTDVTWNPLAGCSIVSPGCTNCYAMRQAARIERMGGAPHYAGLTEMVKGKPVWTGKVALASEKTLLAPLRWKKPRRIFVNSMSDLFHESVPDEWIDKIFAVMALSPQHTFQVLTKRSKRMREYMCADRRSRILDAAIDVARLEEGARAFKDVRELNKHREFPGADTSRWPLPNGHIGVTAEDQTRADERIPDLLATPAAVRFVSVEPMLGPVDLRNIKSPTRAESYFDALDGELWGPNYGRNAEIDWIICGGESGPGARPMHPDWARSLRDQCHAAGTPFFFKQWGEWGQPTDSLSALDWPYHPDHDRTHWFDARTCVRPVKQGWDDKYHSGHCRALNPGVELFKTPEYFCQVLACEQDACRESEECRGNASRAAVTRVGKHRAGRLLDGREHNDFPDPRSIKIAGQR